MDISFVVPFYKGNHYMEQLFGVVRRNAASAKNMSIELILVNDSPDVPVEFQEDWVEGFTLRILNNPQNVGIHESRINGILASEATYIQMLDQDDLLTDNAMLSQLNKIGDNDIVVANGTDQGGSNPGPLYLSESHQDWAARERFYFSVSNMIASPGQCLIRRKAIPKFWMAHPMQKNGSDDLLLWLLMFMDRCRWTTNPQQLYTHVITGENLSANAPKMLRSSWEVLELLQQTGKLTRKQEFRFRRSRSMAPHYNGKSKKEKLLAMLRFPDVTWERLALHSYKHK